MELKLYNLNNLNIFKALHTLYFGGNSKKGCEEIWDSTQHQLVVHNTNLWINAQHHKMKDR